MFIRSFPIALHYYQREVCEPLSQDKIDLLRSLHAAITDDGGTLALVISAAQRASLSEARDLLAQAVIRTKDPHVILQYFSEGLWDISEFFLEFWIHGVDWHSSAMPHR